MSQLNPIRRASPRLPWPRRQCRGSAGTGGRYKASPHPLNKPRSFPTLRASGCRLQEGESCVSKRGKGVLRGGGAVGEGGRPTGSLGTYRSSGAGAGGRATWLGAAGLWRAGAGRALLPAGTGTSPAQGNPRGRRKRAVSPRRVSSHPGVPFPRPSARPARVPAPAHPPGRPQASVAVAPWQQRQQSPRNAWRLGLCEPRSHA